MLQFAHSVELRSLLDFSDIVIMKLIFRFFTNWSPIFKLGPAGIISFSEEAATSGMFYTPLADVVFLTDNPKFRLHALKTMNS